MIPTAHEPLSRMVLLLGEPADLDSRPAPAFDPQRVDFLLELSRALLKNTAVRALPDVTAFAYWCRLANLSRMQKAHAPAGVVRMGLGLVYHICPANVPVNFAYSMAFGLLAGNTNVMRLPSAPSAAVAVIINAMQSLLAMARFAPLKRALLLARFGHDDEINRHWLSRADGRVVWGGDATVAHMRELHGPAHAREVAFPDRYAVCALHAQAVLALDEAALTKLCRALYNDIYLMDQAACSSPQLLAWVGPPETVRAAQDRLWPAFERHVSARYAVTPIQVMDKFVHACELATQGAPVANVSRDAPALYRVALAQLMPQQAACRGYAGVVHEVVLKDLDDLAPVVTQRFQTLTHFGWSRESLRDFVVRNRLPGIDRLVPVGQALDMGPLWDGQDLIASLSRHIDIQ